MAMMAVAAFTACGSDNVYDENAVAQKYAESFSANVLANGTIDENQTWNTAVKTTVKVSSDKAGTIRVYGTCPTFGSTPYLISQSIKAGETLDLTLARPQSAETMYVALVDDMGGMKLAVAEDNGTVSFSTTSTSTRAGMKKVTTKDGKYTFTDQASDEAFEGNWENWTVPSGLTVADAGIAGDYQLPTSSSKVNFWSGKYNVYVKENEDVDYSNITEADNFFVANGSKANWYDTAYSTYSTFYIGAGATFTITAAAFSNCGTGTHIYIADGATLNIVGDGAWTPTAVTIYNKGNITAEAINTNAGTTIYNNTTGSITLTGSDKSDFSSTMIYNKGTFQSTGTGTVILGADTKFVNDGTIDVAAQLNTANATVELVNLGDMKASDFWIQGSSSFYNGGTAEIKNLSQLDCNNGTWINEGQYVTGSFDYTAGTGNYYNNCKLTVNGKFSMHTADGNHNAFYVNGGVVCDEFYMNKGGIYIGANCCFEVKGTATMYVTKDYTDGCISGPTSGDGYGYFHAKEIVGGEIFQQYMANYCGNLYVATKSHFAQGETGGRPYYDLRDNAKLIIEPTAYAPTVPATECNPGYNGGDTPTPAVKQWYYYAFEDLGATDDIDFNDVVVRVSAPENGVSDIELLAAGGTMETYVLVNNNSVFGEVHSAFDAEISEMINTSSVNKTFVADTVTLTAGQDASNLDIKIKIANGSSTSTIVEAPLEGEAPKMIRVMGNSDGKWFWPTERTNISNAYSNFAAWAKNIKSNTDWYETPTGSVVSY